MVTGPGTPWAACGNDEKRWPSSRVLGLSKGEAWFYISGGKEEDLQSYSRVLTDSRAACMIT